MKIKTSLILATLLLILSAGGAMAQGTSFSFQGTLEDNGVPATGSYDLTFQLFDASTNGTAVSSTITGNAITVSNGQFSVILDLGNVFNGSDRWMELGARTNGVGSFITISPRQPITAVAAALVATKAVGLVNNTLSNGIIVNPTISGATILNPAFVGTTNNTALDLYANNQRGLRIEGATDPNLIGGNSGNYVTPGKVGATIAGGGSAGFTNRVSDSYGTVSGGLQNRADAFGTVVGGGQQNTASGLLSTVSGGYGNKASGDYSSVLGGNQNSATNVGAAVVGGTVNRANGLNSVVSGGASNTVTGNYGTVAGGLSNSATADFAFAAGRRAQAIHKGSFVWGDSADTNITSTTSNQFLVRASGGALFTGSVTATNFIGSGAGLTNLGVLSLSSNAVGTAAITNGAITAAKIATNQVVRSITTLPIAGSGATLRDDIVLRAGANIELLANSNVIQIAATSNGVVGWATSGNVLNSNEFLGTVTAQPLEVRVNNSRAMLYEPTTNSPNVIGGAVGNGSLSNAFGATIAGGGTATEPNTVAGNLSTVVGGAGNTANGAYSVAAGRRAKANHAGAVVIADSQALDFASTGANQFLVRAAGGVGINTSTPGAGIALNVNGVLSAKSYASNQLVKSIVAVGDATNVMRDDVRFEAGANVSIVSSGNTIQISANSPGNIGWATEGNLGTTTNNFIGTADNQALELRVNSSRALRIEPSTNSPNLIGGNPGNVATVNAVGATIGGGGGSTNINQVGGNFSTVPGGAGNTATGDFSLAAGNRAKAIQPGTFVWADSTSADFASTGTNQFIIRASGGVGIGTNKPASALHVVGTVTADSFNGAVQGNLSGSFTGNGQAVTNLNASNLSAGTVPDGRLATNVARLDVNANFSALTAASLTASSINGAFSGSGINVSNLNAANLASGTVPDARLAANVARLNGNATFAGAVAATSFNGNLDAADLSTGIVPNARLAANIARLDTNANFAAAVTASSVFASSINAGAFVGSGVNVSNLNAGNLSSGTVPDARLGTNIARLNSAATFAGAITATSITASSVNAGALSGAGATFSGGVSAPSFSGSGANVTELNASALTTGTVPDAQLDSNIARLDSSPAFSGSVGANSFVASNGGGQNSVYVLRQETGDNIQRDLFIDGVSQRMVVPNNTTWAFDGLITARSSKGASAGFQIRGLIANNNGTNSLVGTPVITSLRTTTWKAAIVADKVHQSLSLRVTGLAGVSIRWFATVRTSEVSY